MENTERTAGLVTVAAAGPWGGHSNGEIPLSALTPLSWDPSERLESNAAAAFERLNTAYRAAFGSNISITDSYRTYAQQVAVYNTKGPGLAAKPGTSNHGWALAVDLGGGINGFGTAQHSWMQANAPAYGWIHPYWARKGGGREEPWHWEFDGTTSTTPTPDPSEEDEMNADQDARLRAVEASVNELKVAKQVLFFSSNGTTYEADIASATYRGISSAANLSERKTVLSRAGITWGNWTNASGTSEVANPAAFGRRVD